MIYDIGLKLFFLMVFFMIYDITWINFISHSIVKRTSVNNNLREIKLLLFVNLLIIVSSFYSVYLVHPFHTLGDLSFVALSKLLYKYHSQNQSGIKMVAAVGSLTSDGKVWTT